MIVNPDIEAYAHNHTRAPDPLFDELRDITHASIPKAHMQVGKVEGALLKMLCHLIGARRVLEIGTFTGYSALSMAEGLPDDGQLITCDIDRWRRRWRSSSSPARRTAARSSSASATRSTPSPRSPIACCSTSCSSTRQGALPRLLRGRAAQGPRGRLIIADNTLWSGRVLQPTEKDDHAIVAFNAHVNADPRVENVLISVRDGMMLARKR